jgi:spermidine synthase
MEAFSTVLSRYNGDDNARGTDKLTLHSYGPMYDEIFCKLSQRKSVRVVEIGVYSGAFLKAVCDFLPSARAFGVDIDTSRVRFSDPRMTVYHADATIPTSLDLLAGETYDLIIDDASHLPEHQIATLDLFAPLLTEGGVYVIEDIATDSLEEQLRRKASVHGLTLRMVDLRSVKGRYDDLVAILERPYVENRSG